jgi:MFS family permease
VTGLSFDLLARRLGRRRLFWLSAAGTIAGALLFVAGHTILLTLLAAALLGTLDTLLQTGTSAVLSDRHGKRRDRAFVEANVGASTVAVLAPLLFGFLHGTPVGWHAGLPVVAFGALYMVFRKDALPAPPSSRSDRARQGPLPAGYWLLTLLVAVVVAAEFCVVFYGAQLLQAEVGMSAVDAATVMSLFYVGILLGRVAGSGLTRRLGRAATLVLGTLIP